MRNDPQLSLVSCFRLEGLVGFERLLFWLILVRKNSEVRAYEHYLRLVCVRRIRFSEKDSTFTEILDGGFSEYLEVTLSESFDSMLTEHVDST